MEHDRTPDDFESTRSALHRIAAHVLARRRHQMSGRFGLRASPGGFATPAFGPDPEVVRLQQGTLVRETSAGAAYINVEGSSLSELATFADADLSAEFSVGRDTPPMGATHEPFQIDGAASDVIAGWYDLGWMVLDMTISQLPASSEPAVIQLWPEHFDAGTNVALPDGRRVNLGASPGDSYCGEPYLYVGPWTDDRPGGEDYWNAPFGAVIRRSELLRNAEPMAHGVTFMTTGLTLLQA